jgi:hypothetical protein
LRFIDDLLGGVCRPSKIFNAHGSGNVSPERATEIGDEVVVFENDADRIDLVEVPEQRGAAGDRRRTPTG